MTENEKLQFLETALSPRTNKDAKVRIRQAIPTPDTDVGRRRRTSSNRDEDGSTANSSTRSLWNVIGGSGVGGSSKSSSGSREEGGSRVAGADGEMSDSAKREYLAMVTDPNRFKSYVVVGGGDKGNSKTTLEEEVMEEEVEEVQEEIVDATIELPTTAPQTNEEEDLGEEVYGTTKIASTDAITTTTSNEDNTDGSTLASRLEEDAILREQYETEAKAQREIERIAEAKRIAALQEKWEKERQEVEKGKMERDRLAREEEERKMEEERKVEEERMKKVIAAQEEYWREKLEEERRAKEERLRAKGEKDVAVGGDKKRDKGVSMPIVKDNSRAVTDIPTPITEVASSLSPPPPPPLLPEPTLTTPVVLKGNGGGKVDSSFVQEQARKRAATDRIKEEHAARVKSMNSPIIPSSFSPRTPIVPRDPPKIVVPPPPSPSPPRLTLAQLTMNKKVVAADVKPVAATTTTTTKPPTSKSDSVASPSLLPSSPPRLSLAQLTMGKKKKISDEGLRENKEDNDNDSDGTPKRPKVRQRVPTADDEDDFYEFASGGSNKNLSIKDIMAKQKQDGKSKGGDDMDTMKKKARNYGIDMDKFT